MTRLRSMLLIPTVTAVLVVPAAAASGDPLPSPAVESASCMGSGSAFYDTFAPQQRAFVARFVIDQATATGMAPGGTYKFFAQEKEGGSIPAPCGTRIE